MTKVPVSWKHMSLVCKELKPEKTNKLKRARVWLDIANAYGPVPHLLIFFAIECYGKDPIWVDVLKSYYVGLWSKSFSPTAPSSWHKHSRGIFTGCTVSKIFFLAGMNVILEFIVVETDSSNFRSPLSPPVKAFMDYLFLMSSSLQQTETLSDEASTAL